MFAGQDADRFWRMPEAYLRGNTIKYLRVPDEVGVWVTAHMCQQQASAQFCVLYVLSAVTYPGVPALPSFAPSGAGQSAGRKLQARRWVLQVKGVLSLLQTRCLSCGDMCNLRSLSTLLYCLACAAQRSGP